MTGRLVVEVEPFATMTDVDDPARVVDPSELASHLRWSTGARVVGRGEPVVRQHMLDVHQQQFLVLLLVVEAQLDQGDNGRVRPAIGLDQGVHRLVDPAPVVGDIGHARTADETPIGTGVPLAHGLVVRVEQIAVGLLDRLMAVREEQERLEEPGGVGPVPLRGADVGHRLHDLVFGAQNRRQCLGLVTNRMEAVREGSGGGGLGRGHW